MGPMSWKTYSKQPTPKKAWTCVNYNWRTFGVTTKIGNSCFEHLIIFWLWLAWSTAHSSLTPTLSWWNPNYWQLLPCQAPIFAGEIAISTSSTAIFAVETTIFCTIWWAHFTAAACLSMQITGFEDRTSRPMRSVKAWLCRKISLRFMEMHQPSFIFRYSEY